MNRSLTMSALNDLFSPEKLLEIFPPQRTDEFFEALFGCAEEGAYDIRLALIRASGDRLDFGFELHQRNNMCLACNLTYGLPQVFARHPVINAKGLAAELAAVAGWPGDGYSWEMGTTDQVSEKLHIVPFVLIRR